MLRIRLPLLLTLLAAAPLAAQTQPERWQNPVRKLMKEGKPVIGATISTVSTDIAVNASMMGFDFLWIEMEHSPISLENARNMVLATRGLPCIPFIRLPVNELWTAKRALDAGALGVVFPFTSTPELARQAADATKYPPLGKRGSGPRLPAMRWPSPEGYDKFANENVMTVIMIEEKRAVEKIEEIAATPGIDVLFIGTNDLSFSFGKSGNTEDPEVKAAIAKVLAVGKKNGIPVGLPVRDPGDAERRVAQGFQFLQGPSELVMMQAGGKPILDALGKKPLDPKNKAAY